MRISDWSSDVCSSDLAGVGNAVQIRGTDANRTEINGVSTIGSGAGRSGISFEDLPAALIASVEVTKVPTAQTIEGRSEEHTSELQSLMRISYAVFCLKKKKKKENESTKVKSNKQT